MSGESHDDTDDEVGKADTQYHLEVGDDEVADAVLLPGDPERVGKVTDEWDEATVVADHREYRTATGTDDGTPISVTSTGIGSPSAAIAVEELARVGADTLIRVGSCGGIQPETDIGDLVITSGAVRQEGTSTEYVREDYPAVADHAVVAALAAAAERLDYDYHVGLTASTDSFYAGQSRDGFEGFRARGSEDDIEELVAAGVLNFEMEASAILTLANIYGLRAGAVCTVYADRTTGEFRVEGERRAVRTATLAVSLLAAMDERVADSGADAWHAGLGVDS
jgi:uridine phosphorylase